MSQFLYGECFDYFHEDDLPINWYLVQSRRDHYVGYIHSDNVEKPSFISNAKIVKLSSAIYQYPNFKSNILCQLPLGSELQVDVDHQLNMQGVEEDGEYIYSPALQGWIYKAHLQFNDQLARNPIPIARQFIGQSYLWGGRSGWAVIALRWCNSAMSFVVVCCQEIPIYKDSTLPLLKRKRSSLKTSNLGT